MWSVEWQELSSAVHLDMNSPSPTSGLFDITGRKHEPPDDQLELDPELLRTLNLPHRTSTDSLNSDSDINMIDNWQMNEVFQDISSILDEDVDAPSSGYEHTTDVDELVKNIFDDNSDDTAFLTDPTEQTTATNTSVDLSWIIQETLGSDALPSDDVVDYTCESSSNADADIDYDLLNELEAMEEQSSDVLPVSLVTTSPDTSDLLAECFSPLTETAVESTTSSDTESQASAIANDHQYTQLASVEVKPHETKKQAIRRVKNNAASRVCRKQRKNRLLSNMDKVADLTAKNTELLQKIKDIESVVSILKEHLVKATCKK